MIINDSCSSAEKPSTSAAELPSTKIEEEPENEAVMSHTYFMFRLLTHLYVI